MTAISMPMQKKTVKRTAFCLMSLFLLALFLKNSEIAAKAISSGLWLCVKTLLPSLFPLMVASELLVESGIVQRVGRLLHRPFEALFGLRGDAACAVLLGFVCGFPVGTKCAAALWKSGDLDEQELCRTLAFSNQPSSAFLIYTVGGSMLGSVRLGLCLYLSTLLSATALQLLLRRWNSQTPKEGSAAPPPSARRSFSDALAGAVSHSALAMLSICAFVVFFSSLVESLAHLANALSLSETGRALLFGFFELTSGASCASRLSGSAATILCALSVAWGGCSVHFQLLHLVGEAGFSHRAYFLMKLAQALLNIPILLLLWRWMG